jgi:hypothetical protein
LPALWRSSFATSIRSFGVIPTRRPQDVRIPTPARLAAREMDDGDVRHFAAASTVV